MSEENKVEFEERVVKVNRCSKAVKGGRSMSFNALVVVGDKNGQIGLGFGKASEVADSIRKASNDARKNVFKVALNGHTIPHEIRTKFGASKVLIRPASEGTGLIAGGSMRAVLELAGVRDALAKSLGSSNASNVVKATIEAVRNLRSRSEIYAKRNISTGA